MPQGPARGVCSPQSNQVAEFQAAPKIRAPPERWTRPIAGPNLLPIPPLLLVQRFDSAHRTARQRTHTIEHSHPRAAPRLARGFLGLETAGVPSNLAPD